MSADVEQMRADVEQMWCRLGWMHRPTSFGRREYECVRRGLEDALVLTEKLEHRRKKEPTPVYMREAPPLREENDNQDEGIVPDFENTMERWGIITTGSFSQQQTRQPWRPAFSTGAFTSAEGPKEKPLNHMWGVQRTAEEYSAQARGVWEEAQLGDILLYKAYDPLREVTEASQLRYSGKGTSGSVEPGGASRSGSGVDKVLGRLMEEGGMRSPEAEDREAQLLLRSQPGDEDRTTAEGDEESREGKGKQVLRNKTPPVAHAETESEGDGEQDWEEEDGLQDEDAEGEPDLEYLSSNPSAIERDAPKISEGATSAQGGSLDEGKERSGKRPRSDSSMEGLAVPPMKEQRPDPSVEVSGREIFQECV
jgi:hypothetical protein